MDGTAAPATVAPAPPLAHTIGGAGEPLVLIHGLGGERQIWDLLLPQLTPERTVIAPDLPGFGASPPLAAGDGQPTARRLAHAVAALLDHLGIARATVAGNSLGGWVALELALLGRADAVIGLCPAGLWRRPLAPRRDRTQQLAGLLRPAIPLLVRSTAVRTLALASTVARPAAVDPAAAARMIRAYGAARDYPRVDQAMRAGRFADLAEIAVPVTLAWGEHDRLLSPVRTVPPGVASLQLPGCGHLPMWDEPALVARLLLDPEAAAAELPPARPPVR